MFCAPFKYLEPEDWTVIEFYDRVADQVVNLAPMGGGGPEAFVPRLEAWVAAASLYDVSAEVVDDARYLHGIVSDRIHRPKGLAMMPISELVSEE